MPNRYPFRLIIFLLLSNPHTLLRPFINFKETLVFYELLILFPFFVSTIHPHFSKGKLAQFYVYFSFLLCDNLFLFFPSLYNHFKPFRKFQFPHFLPSPTYYICEFFPTSLFIWYLRVVSLKSSYHRLLPNMCLCTPTSRNLNSAAQ